MSNRKTKFKRGETQRGFTCIGFLDDYGEKCTLLDSSSIEPHIWLGVDEPKIIYGNVAKPVKGALSFMHLNQKQARQLAEELLYFADNGNLREAGK